MAPSTGKGRGKNGKDSELIKSLREACPPHKIKDLDQLVKTLKGDEEKIRQTISEWWEEPVEPQEEAWEDVDRHKAKKKETKQSGRGGRGRSGRGRGEGRGHESRGREGRGGRGREGRGGRGRGDGPARDKVKDQKIDGKPHGDQNVPPPAEVLPTANIRAPQGVWAKKSAEGTSQTKASVSPKPSTPEHEKPAPMASITVPAPAPPAPVAPPKPAPAPAPSGGNVWATRGSAHLIRAEKPKPPAPAAPPGTVAPIQRSTPLPPKSTQEPPAPKPQHPEPAPAALPAPAPPTTTLEGSSTSAWTQGPPSEAAQPQSSIGTQPIGAPIAPVEKSPAKQAPAAGAATKPPQGRPAPANVLKMGHWETGDADDSNLDFGFGSFGTEDAATSASNQAAQQAAPAPKESAAPPPPPPPAATASPARPPPGLSISGMPPMPANAVLVHELENKLDETTLNAKQNAPADKPISSTLPQPPPGTAPTSGPPPQQYGMGMYNYSAATPGSGFVGVPGAPAPVIGGPPPQQKPQAGGPPNGPQHQGGAFSSGNAPGPAATGSTPSDSGPTPAGMPPGVPNMPYANPALYYQQQPFHMGQHQGGIGYNYGYGAQFTGAVQGGFGYPQAMGQSGGYGHGPHYDEQAGHSGGSGGYQKSSGGYRGRNQHHSNSQYQNQYNPQQHGGYGGQPYGMGHYGDHFNQRGGYGGMQDPYGMQQQQQQQQQQQGGGNYGGGFQDDDQYKGRKGNRGGFQQQGPPSNLGGQAPFGLQGQGSDSNQQSGGPSGTSGGGGGGGGWPNQGGAGGSGWSSGASNWQGK